MDIIWILLGVVLLVTPVGLILCWVWIAGLNRRLIRLEEAINRDGDADTHGVDVPEGRLERLNLRLRELRHASSDEAASAQDAGVVTPSQIKEPEPVLDDGGKRPALDHESVECERADVTGPESQGSPEEPPADEAMSSEPVVSSGQDIVAKESFEEALGSRILVWVGGVALALAGGFLVKYSWDNNLLSPEVRLLLAACFGLVCIGVASWMHPQAARVASALAGAGVAILYGVNFAATSVYEFIGPTLGFITMAGITACAVMLSLRHGAYVALLALVGGFLSPAFIGDPDGSVVGLFAYLVLLQVGMVIVTRRRGWSGLSGLSLVGTLVWAILMAIFDATEQGRFWGSLLLIVSAVLYVLNAARVDRGPDAQQRAGTLTSGSLSLTAIGAALALLGLFTAQGGYGLSELVMLAAMSAGVLVLARLDRRYLAMPWIALVVSLVLLVSSSQELDAALTQQIALLYGSLFAAGASLCMLSGSRDRSTIILSATGAWPFALSLLFVQPDVQLWMLSWWALAISGAGYVVLSAVMLSRNRLASSVLLVAGLGWITWSLGTGLQEPWLATAWMSLGWIAARFTPWVRHGSLPKWSLLWLGVLSGLSLGWLCGQQAWATTWYTVTVYGSCAGLAAAIAWCLRGDRLIRWRDGYAVAAAIIPLVAGTRLIHQGFHGQEVLAEPSGLVEIGSYTLLLLAYPLGLALAARLARWGAAVERTASVIAMGASLLTVAGLGLMANPFVTNDPILGWPVINLITVFYLPAGALLLALAFQPSLLSKDAATAVGSIGLGVLGLMLILLIRHTFIGSASGLLMTLPRALEWSVHVTVFLLAAETLRYIQLPNHDELSRTASRVFLVMGWLATVGLVLPGSPLWLGQVVGEWPIFNELLPAYGIPMLLFAWLASRLERDPARRSEVVLCAVTALFLAFVLVTLQVRQAFNGSDILIQEQTIAQTEWYAYSLSWIVLGVSLLIGGLLRRNRWLRIGSLVIILMAVGKVFLLDTAHLEGLLRVVSFLGLGLTLIAIGFLYQRFVFSSSSPSQA
ncbi:MAG: DUF2339 domain-containing protein [Phycisphaeraceae bacterium]